MCYPKPGPRCSHHAEERLTKALTRLKTVTEDYQEEQHKLIQLHADDAAYTFTEEDLPRRTIQRVKTAQMRVLSSYRMLDATPEGKKELESLFSEAQANLTQRISELKEWEDKNNLTTTDSKNADEKWVELNSERISAYSILSRLRNRHSEAIAYRDFCLQEYNFEQTRHRLFSDLRKHAEQGALPKYILSGNKMKSLNEQRVGAKIAEHFYQKLPVFSQAPSSFPLSVGEEERSTHYVELSQGRQAKIENKSVIMETGDTVTVHHVSEVYIRDPQGEEGTRKGYGVSLKGKPAVFSLKGKTYPDVETAQKDLADNRVKTSYLLADRAVFALLAQIDGQRLKKLHSMVQDKYEERKSSLVNTAALSS